MFHSAQQGGSSYSNFTHHGRYPAQHPSSSLYHPNYQGWSTMNNHYRPPNNNRSEEPMKWEVNHPHPSSALSPPWQRLPIGMGSGGSEPDSLQMDQIRGAMEVSRARSSSGNEGTASVSSERSPYLMDVETSSASSKQIKY